MATIREDRPPAITAEDGRRTVEVITAAHEANRTGRTIVLDASAG